LEPLPLLRRPANVSPSRHKSQSDKRTSHTRENPLQAKIRKHNKTQPGNHILPSHISNNASHKPKNRKGPNHFDSFAHTFFTLRNSKPRNCLFCLTNKILSKNRTRARDICVRKFNKHSKIDTSLYCHIYTLIFPAC